VVCHCATVSLWCVTVVSLWCVTVVTQWSQRGHTGVTLECRSVAVVSLRFVTLFCRYGGAVDTWWYCGNYGATILRLWWATKFNCGHCGVSLWCVSVVTAMCHCFASLRYVTVVLLWSMRWHCGHCDGTVEPLWSFWCHHDGTVVKPWSLTYTAVSLWRHCDNRVVTVVVTVGRPWLLWCVTVVSLCYVAVVVLWLLRWYCGHYGATTVHLWWATR